MGVKITPFAPELLPALKRFCERVWERPRSLDFYRWRFLELPSLTTLMAVTDNECVGTLCALKREYLFAGEIVACLETFDWHCLPEYRSGVGLLMMRRIMERPEPIVVVGGTEQTAALFSRLHWQAVPPTTRYSLPLQGRVIAQALQRRYHVPRALGQAAFKVAGRHWFSPRRRQAPAAAHSVAVATIGAEALALYQKPTVYGTVPLYDLAFLRWLTGGFAGAGHFVPFYFAVGSDLRGWGLLRLYQTHTGCDAMLVEAFVPEPEVATYAWMISEMISVAASFRPGRVLAQTTCPILGSALRENGFLSLAPIPVSVWSQDHRLLPEPRLLGFNTGDTMLLPYPSRWWGDPLTPRPEA